MDKSKLQNQAIRDYQFLVEMYEDGYFPNFLVDKCKEILLALCFEIESKKPQNLDNLYVLTHAATDAINELEDEFFENESEIETAARDALGNDFEFIAKSYGFDNADLEELIATREW